MKSVFKDDASKFTDISDTNDTKNPNYFDERPSEKEFGHNIYRYYG